MENKKISSDILLAGALQRLQQIDLVDLKLLTDLLREKLSIEIDYKIRKKSEISAYLKTQRNGTILFRSDITLDKYLEEEGLTVLEKLQIIAGGEISSFFNELNSKDYYNRKKVLLNDNKRRAGLLARILLISDNEDDYKTLQKEGYRNIDYFKSVIVADKYFKDKKEKLYDYHLVLLGDTPINSDAFDETDLERFIKKISITTNLKYLCYSNNSFEDNESYLLYEKIGRDAYSIEENSKEGFLEAINKYTFISLITELLKRNEFKKIPKYQEQINPELPLPRKKSELKILYLDHYGNSEEEKMIAEELGLDITFIQDDNFAFKKNCKDKLGDYDIIIGSDAYSSILQKLKTESEEQCKLTGRQLVLLMNYRTDPHISFDPKTCTYAEGLGSDVTLKYIIAGSDKDKTTSIKYKLFRKAKYGSNDLDDKWVGYANKRYSQTRSIISSAVNIYNDFILNSHTEIEDNDLDSIEDFNNEFSEESNKSDIEKSIRLKAIEEFDEMRNTISKYIELFTNNFTIDVPKEIKIRETENHFTIKILKESKTIAVLKYEKRINGRTREFELQILNKKGKLSKSEMYHMTSGAKLSDNIQKVMNAIEKKVMKEIKPINETAMKRTISDIPKKKRRRIIKKKT